MEIIKKEPNSNPGAEVYNKRIEKFLEHQQQVK